MPYEYVAYIDESGDEGYNIALPPVRRASEWFILSAAMCRAENQNRIDTALARERPFHFREARHHQCVGYANAVAHLPVTLASVIVHKPTVANDAALRTQSHYLFDYSTKLLLERISWFCDDNKRSAHGTVKIIFSKRRQLKLDRVRTYLQVLRHKTEAHPAEIFGPDTARKLSGNSIRWNVIRDDLIEAEEHGAMVGLQIGDAVATSTARALEYSPTWNTEHRYIKILKDRFYRSRNGRALGYGMKFLFDECSERGPLGVARYHWLHHFK